MGRKIENNRRGRGKQKGRKTKTPKITEKVTGKH